MELQTSGALLSIRLNVTIQTSPQIAQQASDMTKTCDLFAGCHVTIAPHDDAWLISLVADGGGALVTTSFPDLLDAMQAVSAWMHVLTDDTDIGPHGPAVSAILRGVLARNVHGNETLRRDTVNYPLALDDLRAWFEREMNER